MVRRRSCAVSNHEDNGRHPSRRGQEAAPQDEDRVCGKSDVARAKGVTRMPEITVSMAAGRTDEQKAGMMRDITQALVKNLGVDADAVVIQINEAPLAHKMKGGKTFVERAAAQKKYLRLSFRDAPLGAGPESITTTGSMDSGLALRAPRNDDDIGACVSTNFKRIQDPWMHAT